MPVCDSTSLAARSILRAWSRSVSRSTPVRWGAGAVSLATFTHPDFSYAAKFTRKLATAVIARGLPDKTLLNVNIPNIPEDKIKGVAITRQGESRVEERFEKRTDPRNQTYYWLDGTFRLQEVKDEADAAMVSDGYVSITPVQYDLTAYPAIDKLKEWKLQP